jgi:hypothetical protein
MQLPSTLSPLSIHNNFLVGESLGCDKLRTNADMAAFTYTLPTAAGLPIWGIIIVWKSIPSQPAQLAKRWKAPTDRIP